jgi:F-type H+-transporting ATPase subunit epsilon
MATLHLKVVTPEDVIFDDDVSMVVAETLQGEIGILPQHINLLTKIVPGELRIKKGDKVTALATGEGLLQIVDNTVSILTDQALESSEIDEKSAREAHERAKVALEQKLSAEEYAATRIVLEKSLAQLKVKRRHRSI